MILTEILLLRQSWKHRQRLLMAASIIPLRIFAECLSFQVEYCEYTDGSAYIIVTDRKPAYDADKIINLCGQVSGKI